MTDLSRSCSLILVFAFLGCACGGCVGVGWLATVLAPQQKVKPLFKLPGGKTLLVFVDGSPEQLAYEPIKAELTERLNEQLKVNRVVVETVPFRTLLDLMSTEPDFDRLYISQVGRRTGADLVLYVLIERFQLRGEEVGPLWQGRFETSVKVVDVKDGRLWPTDRRGGYPLEPVQTPMEAEMSPDYNIKLARRLADMMADRIAKCFYEHQVTEEQAPIWAGD